ncbi:hypothetical protein FDENT_6126 [Fusarium denticulatum]|uniref:Uncharacterized protein n=1 Tax=Fusarium denticulatum TaxID=48507 RepID=A0A8H5X7V0_9HYPO|nr:hypothetical protein FDENT_6126 [Fusarium denticulatum]
MDFISMFKLITVRDPEPGESRMAFHFVRKPESSSKSQDSTMSFEQMLTLYVFAGGYDWTAHKEETLKICEEKEIERDWRLMRMVMSACVDNTE